jgi:hypothetical protein
MEISGTHPELLMYELEELGSQVKQLKASQELITEALVQEPDDKDFLDAVQENEVAINRRQDRMMLIHEELMIRDPAYRQEMQRTVDLSSTVSSISIVDQQTRVRELHLSRQQQALDEQEVEDEMAVRPQVDSITGAEPTEGGLYL